MPTDSLYLLCRHDNLMNGFLCRQCLDEGIGGQGLCEHYNPWQTCNLCQHSKAWLLHGASVIRQPMRTNDPRCKIQDTHPEFMSF